MTPKTHSRKRTTKCTNEKMKRARSTIAASPPMRNVRPAKRTPAQSVTNSLGSFAPTGMSPCSPSAALDRDRSLGSFVPYPNYAATPFRHFGQIPLTLVASARDPEAALTSSPLPPPASLLKMQIVLPILCP
jgi:hypothetical protein